MLPLTRAMRDAARPGELVERAMEGNRRFRTGRRRHRDLLAEMRGTAAGQYPAAVLLSCIDSRAPAEIVFDLGLGDILNCRVAGHVVGPDVIGSLEYGARVAGAKLVLVLGHSACGAVMGALEGLRLGHLSQLLEKLWPAIESTRGEGERSAEDAAFVDAVARRHVELTVERLRGESPVIATLERTGALRLAGAFYDVSTGAVEFLVGAEPPTTGSRPKTTRPSAHRIRRRHAGQRRKS